MLRNSDIDIMFRREYQDGDIVEFYFEPNSVDIRDFHTVKLVGVVTGILIEEGNRIYMIQLRDDSRNIHGSVTIPEEQINMRIEN